MKYTFSPDIHDVQRHILTQLMIHPPGLHYAQMMPEKVDNDRYNYHLQYLVQQGLITKESAVYKLSSTGIQLMSNFNANGQQQKLYRVSVALYVFRQVSTNQEILRQKRLRHPYYGDISGIAGKIQPGELIKAAAKRKLREESGLTADFTITGTLRKIRYTADNALFEDSFYYICYAAEPTGELESLNVHGENFWLPITEAVQAITHNQDIGDKDGAVIQRLADGNLTPFAWEESVRLQLQEQAPVA